MSRVIFEYLNYEDINFHPSNLMISDVFEFEIEY